MDSVLRFKSATWPLYKVQKLIAVQRLELEQQQIQLYRKNNLYWVLLEFK